jgi:hypothetical protein
MNVIVKLGAQAYNVECSFCDLKAEWYLIVDIGNGEQHEYHVCSVCLRLFEVKS